MAALRRARDRSHCSRCSRTGRTGKAELGIEKSNVWGARPIHARGAAAALNFYQNCGKITGREIISRRPPLAPPSSAQGAWSGKGTRRYSYIYTRKMSLYEERRTGLGQHDPPVLTRPNEPGQTRAELETALLSGSLLPRLMPLSPPVPPCREGRPPSPPRPASYFSSRSLPPK
jgi:hypothetical protein